MTTTEFIRLRPADGDGAGDKARRTFVCELPDAESDDDDVWLDCGRVVAFATHGRLTSVEIHLNEVFASQYDMGRYDPAEVLGVVVVWIGWETGWVSKANVSMRLRNAQGTLDCVYNLASDRVDCGTEIHQRKTIFDNH